MFILPIPEDGKVTRSDQSLLVMFAIKLVFKRGNFLTEAFCEISIRKWTDPWIYIHNFMLIIKPNSFPWLSSRCYQLENSVWSRMQLHIANIIEVNGIQSICIEAENVEWCLIQEYAKLHQWLQTRLKRIIFISFSSYS